jgi:hypothetical protein
MSDFKRRKCEVDFQKRKNPNFEPQFCSKKCMHEYAHKNIVYHDYICLECGNMFQRSEREIKNANKKNQPIKFCSRECKDKHWGRNQLNVKCDCCGKEFKVQQKLKNKKHYFCSSECCKIYNKENDIRGNFTEFTCKFCQKKFKLPNSYVKKQTKRNQNISYCSIECMHHNAIDIKEKNKKTIEELKCDFCGEKINKPIGALKNFFEGKNKHIYCSSKCSHEARKKRVEVSCDYCNKKYEIIESKFKNHKKHFCCNEHKKLYLHKEKETYTEVAHYLRSTTEYEIWKNSCLKRDNYTCQKCGSRSDIIVHHIEQLYSIVQKYNNNLDDIVKSIEFNDLKNGLSLCTECHQKEHPWMRNQKGQFVNSIAVSSSTDSEDDD